MESREIYGQLERIESSLSKLHDKIDSHAERLAVVETDVGNFKGAIKIGVTFIAAGVSAIVTYVLRAFNSGN